MTPNEILTTETFQFIVKQISPPMRILEVGCGVGQLAARLQAGGFEVQAIDSDSSQAMTARDRGVDARCGDFISMSDEPYEAILFARSLHHLFPLEVAVAHAKTLLTPGGKIIVDDFAFDEIDPRTVHWLYGTLFLLRTCDRLQLDDRVFGRELLDCRGDLAAWRKEHGGCHKIHTAREMASAIHAQFAVTLEEPAPYLYRYVAPMLSDDEAGGCLLNDVLELEKAMIQAETILPIGRRIVGDAPMST